MTSQPLLAEQPARMLLQTEPAQARTAYECSVAESPAVASASLAVRAGRLAWRLPVLVECLSVAPLDYALRRFATGTAWSPLHRAEWMRRWAVRVLNLMAVRLTVRGTPPAKGLLVANHLGYLDVLVLATLQPLVFVGKADVRRWPLFGLLARCAGTLFINRNDRVDVKRLGAEFAPLLNHGLVLALFPEGTSSGGERVLPFHSALFEPVVEDQWPVTPAWIGYALSDGDATEEVCYWRDMTFLPHLLNLLTKSEIEARVIYGTALAGARDHKWLAWELHTQVCVLSTVGQRRVSNFSPKPHTLFVRFRRCSAGRHAGDSGTITAPADHGQTDSKARH